MDVLYRIPSGLVLAGAIVFAAAYGCGLQLVVRRRLKRAKFVAPAAPVFSTVNTLYAVVLGFLSIIVWQHYNDTKERVWLEVSAVADTWHDAVGLRPAVRHDIRAEMLAYTHLMIDTEWALMQHGSFSPRGDALIMAATTRVGTLVPTNAGEASAQSAVLRLLGELHDARARRLAQNDAAITGFDWTILVLGAMLVVAMCWLFGETRSDLLTTGGVAVLLAMMLVLILEMQYPFRGANAVRPDAWTAFLHHVEWMDRGSMPSMKM